MLKLPKCPVCETRRWTKRIRDDWFRCTNCSSVWMSKGFTEKERLARFCPVCDTFVEYDNWKPYWEGYWNPWDTPKLKNFHFDCHDKYVLQVEQQKIDFNKEIEKAEIVSQIECPKCKTQNICIMPEGWNDIIYWCVQCEISYPEEWIYQKIAEIRRAQAFEIVKSQYKPYVTRGDPLEYIRRSLMGVGIPNQYTMTQGSYFREEKMKPNEIAIEFPDNSYYIFKLEDVYKSIKEVMLIARV